MNWLVRRGELMSMPPLVGGTALISPARLVGGSVILTLACMLFIYLFTENDRAIFYYLMSRYDMPAGGVHLFLLAVAGVSARFWPRDVSAFLRMLGRNPLPVAGLVVVILAISERLIYRDHPLSMDEYSVWFQARIFAEGRLAASFPPELADYLFPQRFGDHFIAVNRDAGLAASTYWPGFALLLAPFAALRASWLCNPLIVGISVLILWRIARDQWNDEIAQGWVVLLALASPVFLVNGVTYYSMPAHLLANLLFAWLLMKPTPLRVAGAGFVGSWALILHNPFPHLLFMLPWAMWLLIRRTDRWRNILLLAFGYLPVLIVIGFGWRIWMTSMVLSAPSHSEGIAGIGAAQSTALAISGAFGWLKHLPLHLPDESILAGRLGGLVKLWLWSCPMLLILAFLGARSARSTTLELVWWSALITFFGYFLVPYNQGHGWGNRYFHPALMALPLLATRYLLSTEQCTAAGQWLRNTVFLGALASISIAVPLRFAQVGEFVTEHLSQMPPGSHAERQLVFLDGRGYYPYDLVQSDPWLRGRIVMLSSSPQKDQEMVSRHFPDAVKIGQNKYGRVYDLPRR